MLGKIQGNAPPRNGAAPRDRARKASQWARFVGPGSATQNRVQRIGSIVPPAITASPIRNAIQSGNSFSLTAVAGLDERLVRLRTPRAQMPHQEAFTLSVRTAVTLGVAAGVGALFAAGAASAGRPETGEYAGSSPPKIDGSGDPDSGRSASARSLWHVHCYGSRQPGPAAAEGARSSRNRLRC